MIPPKPARHVRLLITQSGIDSYARLPEFEVYGYQATAACGWVFYP